MSDIVTTSCTVEETPRGRGGIGRDDRRTRAGPDRCGRGRQGTSFAESAKHIGAAEIVVVCDPWEAARDRFRLCYGVKAVAGSDELLDSSVDAVILASPQQYHTSVTCLEPP